MTPLQIQSDLQFVNYPIKIKEKTEDKDPINLPANSNDDDQNKIVEIKMGHYFSGWINKYEISCSYAQKGEIVLKTPVRRSYLFDDLKSPVIDMDSGNKYSVVLLESGAIYYLSETTKMELNQGENQNGDMNCQ